MNADIANGFLFNQRQQLCHAIAEWFGADKIHFGKQSPPDAPDARRRQNRFQVEPRQTIQQGIIEINPQLRQQFFHQLQMMTAQGFTAAPPKKLKAFLFFAHFTAALRAFTRSVFSQEKPPSFSAVRPKWP